MLTKVMKNTKLWFRVVSTSSSNIVSGMLYWIEPQYPWFKTTKHTQTEESLNKIPTHWKIINPICLNPLQVKDTHWEKAPSNNSNAFENYEYGHLGGWYIKSNFIWGF